MGTASGYPQLRELYGSALSASSFLAAVPLAAMFFGPLWGPISRRLGLRRSLLVAVSGWSVTMLLLGLTMGPPAVGIVLRAAHGAFDVALVSLSLAAATRSIADRAERRRFFSLFETAASVGAIFGPLTVGLLMLVSMRWAFIALAGLGAAYIPFVLRQGALPVDATGRSAGSGGAGGGERPEDAAESARSSDGGRPPATRRPVFPVAMIAPGVYAIAVLVLISASEAFLPGYLEGVLQRPWLGKLGVALYEVLVIGGVLLKSRIDGTRYWPPVVTGIALAAAATVALFGGASVAIVGLLALSGVGIGMSLTMSHEFAAHMTGGDAEGGMTVYASMRISGAVVGPYLVALGFPALLLPLAAVSVLSAPLLRAEAGRGNR